MSVAQGDLAAASTYLFQLYFPYHTVCSDSTPPFPFHSVLQVPVTATTVSSSSFVHICTDVLLYVHLTIWIPADN